MAALQFFKKSNSGFRAVILVFAAIIISQPFSAQNNKKKLDSLFKALATAQHDTALAGTHYFIGSEIYFSQPEKSMVHTRKAIELCDKSMPESGEQERMIFKKIKADAISDVAFYHTDKGNVDSAISLNLKSLELRKEIGDQIGIAQSYNNLGAIYRKQGHAIKAIDNYQKSLLILEKVGFKQGTAYVLGNIGQIYSAQDDFEKALEYNLRSIKIREAINDRQGIAISLSNIGIIYSKKKDFDIALDYFKRSMKLSKQNDDRKYMGQTLNLTGEVYIQKRNYDKALETFQKAYAVQKEFQDKAGLAKSTYNLAKVYRLKNNPDSAAWYSDYAYRLSETLGYPEDLKNASGLLKDIYAEKEDYKSAFRYFTTFMKMSDSIRNENNRRESIKKQFQFEFEMKNAVEKAKAKAEKEKIQMEHEARDQRQNFIIFSAVGGLVVVLGFLLFMYNRFRVIRRQKHIIEDQKKIVEEKNKEITDSINYAQKIQTALLPSETEFKRLLQDYFILFQPKDIVSGDFYWLTEKNGKVIYATADCTGHGVPGGFMSMLGSSFLDEIVKEKGITSPGKILDLLRDHVVKALKQTGASGESKDAIDMVLCSVDRKNLTLAYAAANNSFYIIRNGELIECRADKQPVGYHNEFSEFKQQEVPLKKGDLILTLTDGYADQFGGGEGKKFKYKQLEKILTDNWDKPMHELKEILLKKFTGWKGKYEQVDDVCLIGVRV